MAAPVENIHDFVIKSGGRWLAKPCKESDKHHPTEEYYYTSTLYVFARVICWIEILKREQIYLDFSSTKETRIFNAYLSLIYSVLSSPGFGVVEAQNTPSRNNHWFFFHNLSAIGEVMMEADDAKRLTCISYLTFCTKYKTESEAGFRLWINEVERFFVELSNDEVDIRQKRLQVLWYCLDRFLEFVDPDQLQTTRDRSNSRQIDAQLKAAAAARAGKFGILFAA